MRTSKSVVSTLFAALLVLASCGGSDSDSEAGATTTVPPSPATIQSGDATTAPTTAAPTTEAPTTEAPTTEAPTTTATEGLQSTSGGNPARFCELSAENDALDAMYPDSFIDPIETEAYLTELVPLLEEGTAVAPGEIAGEFQTLATAFTEIRDELALNDYNLLLVIDEVTLIIEDPDVEQAGDAVSTWRLTNCDGATDDGDDGGTAIEDLDPEELNEAMAEEGVSAELLQVLLSTDTGRQLFIEGFVSETSLTFAQGECFIDNVSVETLAALTSSEPTDEQGLEVLTAITDCEIPLDAFG